MLSSIEIRPSNGSVLSLPIALVGPGYPVYSVDGLGPVKATHVSNGTAKLDGAQLQSTHIDSRNIVITLGFEPNYAINETVASMREKLYSYMVPADTVTVRIILSDGRSMELSATVETVDPAIFSNDPVIVITLIAYKPMFNAINEVVIPGNTVTGVTDIPIVYPGTAKTGITFIFSPNRAISDFTLYNRQPDGIVTSMSFSTSLIAGDVLTVTTTPRERSIIRMRSGVQTGLLQAKDIGSAWTELIPGTNNIRVVAAGAAIPYEIRYLSKFVGI